MRIGGLKQWVDLDDPIEDGTPKVFTPNRVPARVVPGPPGAYDENKVTYQVEMRYHPQVTFNTRLRFTDAARVEHQLFVRGVQNVEMRNRDLVLLCEEVLTP
jgi:hypothetical protein